MVGRGGISNEVESAKFAPKMSVKKKKARTGVGMGEQGCVEKRRREASASVVASMSEFDEGLREFGRDSALHPSPQGPGPHRQAPISGH